MPEISLETAKLQIGKALRATIRRTDSSLKEYGDPSQVYRACEGDIPNVLARAWQRDRREFVKALAEESGCFDIHTTINERRRA